MMHRQIRIGVLYNFKTLPSSCRIEELKRERKKDSERLVLYNQKEMLIISNVTVFLFVFINLESSK